VAGQDQADHFRAPAGVLLAQRLGLQDQRVRSLGSSGRMVIGGCGNVAAVAVAEPEQVVDRAERQVEPLGQGLGGQPSLAGLEQSLTDREWDSAWHKGSLLKQTTDHRRAKHA
jgi:hypothetical protein